MTDHKYTPWDVRWALQKTQAEMATLVGMSESGYRKWENGVRGGSGSAQKCLQLLLEVDRLQVEAGKTAYWRKRYQAAAARLKKKKI